MNYELQYKQMRAVCTTMGAELISLTKANGREVIWQGDKTYWGGVNPNLFPIVCSLKNSKTVIDGVEYTIPKHGFARRMEFEMVEKSENSITFLLTDNETTKECYPYSFGLYITHTLTEDGFITTYRVENRSNKTMLFGLGGHTAYNCPMAEGDQFTDYEIRFNKAETNPVYQCVADDLGGLLYERGIRTEYRNVTKIPLEYSIFDLDALMFSKLNSNVISLVHKEKGYGVEVTVNGFNSLGIWTPIGLSAPFICIEPWTIIPDKEDTTGIFAEKPNITALPMGESKEYSYQVRLI